MVPNFWTDPDIKRKLTRDEKHLLLYCFTSPHSKGSMTGVYYCPLEYVANETDLPVKEVQRMLAGPLAPFVSYDETTEEVFVHAFAKHNVGEELKIGDSGKEDRRIEGVRRQVRAIHSLRVQRLFLERYGSAFHLNMSVPDLREAPCKPLGSPLEGGADAPISPSEAIALHSIPSHDIVSPASPEDRGGWPGEFTRMYEPIGILKPGQIGKALSPVVTKYGVERTKEMWGYYIRHAPSLRFGRLDPTVHDTTRMSPADFVKQAGTWFAKTQPINGGPRAATAS